MWRDWHPMSRHFEAMQQELQALRQECEVLTQHNSALRQDVNTLLSKESWMVARFERLRSETADLRQTAISSHDTQRTNPQRKKQVSIYGEIIDYLQVLSHDKIRLGEALRRERELRAQTEEEASAAAARHQEITSEMMIKLNSLQMRGEALYDDQCASEWRKLQQALDVWTRRTFMDKLAMSHMTKQSLEWTKDFYVLPEDMLQDIHGKHAYIQGTIAGIIFKTVFSCLFACSPSGHSERLLSAIGKALRRSGSSYTWETWRSATSKALDDPTAFEEHRHDDSCNSLSQTIDLLFSDFYSQNIGNDRIHSGLHRIFQDCLAFKKRLERQESDYVIRQTPPGTVYSAAKMNSLNYNEEEGSTVMMSIWPSIYKVSFDNEELLIEPEAVWTKKPTQIDESGTEDLYDIEKDIKQEVKSEEDDEELSLIMINS